MTFAPETVGLQELQTNVSTDNQSSCTASGYNVWYSWDVSSAIQAMASGSNYGFRLIQDGLTTARGKCFYKSTQGYIPELVLTYTNGSTIYAANSSGTTTAYHVYAADANGVVKQCNQEDISE